MARDGGIEARVRCHGAASIGRGLHELAEPEQADLLVVGSSSRGSVDRVVLGETPAMRSTGPVRGRDRAGGTHRLDRRPIKRIGVGDDGSPETERALRVARALAVGGPDDRGLTPLRAAGTAGSWQHVAAAHALGPLPAANPDAGGAGSRADRRRRPTPADHDLTGAAGPAGQSPAWTSLCSSA
jgi:nucleotide-binding universal stress UspA family protein